MFELPAEITACATCNPLLVYGIVLAWFLHGVIELILGKKQPLGAGSVPQLLIAIASAVLVGLLKGKEKNGIS